METVSTESVISTMSLEQNQILAEEMNDEMTSSVLPVTIFVGIEIVFGFFGNLLILYVFLVRYHSCNFKYFVLCLAFIDTTSTMTTMPGEIVTQVFWYVYPVPLVCKIKSFFNVFTVCASAFCLLLIAVDRFRKICRPLEWQVKHRMAMRSCFALLFVSFLMALPCAFLWGTHSYQTDYKGQIITVTVCEKDAKYLDTEAPFIYIIIVETVISLVLIVLFVLYVFVCRVLLTADDKSNSLAISAQPVRLGTINNFHLQVPGPQNSEGTISRGVTSDDDLTTQESGEEIQDEPSSQLTVQSRNLNKTKSNATTTRSSAAMEHVKLKKKKKRPTVKQQARRVRRKTLIMFILTAIFIVTTVLYLTLLSLIANDFLGSLSSSEKALYFFFFRLYFINHAVNPVLYGFLDPHFRRVLKIIAKTIVSPCKRQSMVHNVSYSAGSSQN